MSEQTMPLLNCPTIAVIGGFLAQTGEAMAVSVICFTHGAAAKLRHSTLENVRANSSALRDRNIAGSIFVLT